MLHLGLRGKLLIAFLVMSLPMLALILFDYSAGHRRLSEDIIDDQLRTSQAVAVLADESIDDAFSVAWSSSRDPVIRSLNPNRIDPYLESQASFFPQLDDIAVFDLAGNTVGSMVLHAHPGAARPNASDRAYFQAVKSTGQPYVDRIVISRASGKPVVVVAVPLLNDSGTVEGVTIATLNLDRLAKRVATVGLRKSQTIFMTDREGTIAFDTDMSADAWGRRNLADYPPVRTALTGSPARERNIMTPQGDFRIVATTSTEKYGWAVGVSIPTSEALAPVQSDLIRRLLLFSGVLALADFAAVLLSRRVILRPLQVLMGHLRAFGRGELDRRIDLHTGDEMEAVAQTFNQMATQLQEWSKERETLLEEAVKARAELEETRLRREEFISMVAHDFRNPLAVVMGYGEMVSRTAREGRPIAPRIADNIVSQAERMRRLVDDLSAVSLIEAGRFEVLKTFCDLRKTAHDVVEQQQMMTTRHSIVLAAPPEPIMGTWDYDRLDQALNNLVYNAIKYSPHGGAIEVRLVATDAEVTVSVSDEGIGIAPENVGQLFQPFSRVNPEQPMRGTGLGLFIVKAIAEAHGGRVWLDSQRGKGSTFYMAIPRGVEAARKRAYKEKAGALRDR